MVSASGTNSSPLAVIFPWYLPSPYQVTHPDSCTGGSVIGLSA